MRTKYILIIKNYDKKGDYKSLNYDTLDEIRDFAKGFPGKEKEVYKICYFSFLRNAREFLATKKGEGFSEPNLSFEYRYYDFEASKLLKVRIK